MNIKDVTLNDLQNLKDFNENAEFDGVVFVPMDELHIRGWQCMKFVLTNHLDIVGCVGGDSDLFHMDGRWNIDCLPTSKCIRLFTTKKYRCRREYGEYIIEEVSHESNQS